jgi:hypothetical protein
MTAEELAEIRERVGKATPGPWSVRHNYHEGDRNGNEWRDSDIRFHPTGVVYGGIPQVLAYADLDEADAEFIAAAREWVPKLLDEIEESHRRFKAVDGLAAYRSENIDRLDLLVEELRTREASVIRERDAAFDRAERAEADSAEAARAIQAYVDALTVTQARIDAALEIHARHEGLSIGSNCMCVTCEMAKALKGGGDGE